MSVAVICWWALLCLIGALNISAWAYSAVRLRKQKLSMAGEEYSARRLQLLLAAGYVFGCAFRSFLPVYDVPRITLVDSWLSTAMVGRSVATIAELCFACQWAFLMRETAKASGSFFASGVSKMVVPMLAIAEACSWYSVLTTSNLGHVLEESLWGLCAAMVVACMVMIRPRCSPIPRSAVITWCVFGVAYVAYMFLVDVPMYWSRWLADQAAGRSYFAIVQGVLDASNRRVVTFDLGHWRSEMLWMGLYFSVAVWISLSLIHIPATVPRGVESKARRRPWVLAGLILPKR